MKTQLLDYIKYLERKLASYQLSDLIPLMKKDPVMFTKFSLRVIFRELPGQYWQKVIILRFPKLINAFKNWFFCLESDEHLKYKLIDLTTEKIYGDILQIKKTESYYIPSSGIILDIGSGYLSLSKNLIAKALESRDISLYLIDNAELPYEITNRVLQKLGSPDNISTLKASADKLPFNNSSVDAITLLKTLHELSKTLYYIELHRNIENLRADKEALERAYPEYVPFIKEFHRVLKEEKQMVIVDKIMDSYNIEFVKRPTKSLFLITKEEHLESKFTLILKKIILE